MTKTKTGRFSRLIAMLLALIMVCGLLPISVFADNTTQNIPNAGFYTDTVTTRLDGEIPVTDDTYYQNAISTEVANPTLPTIVKQSQSTDTIYDFAAGLPLSTIFIDETKLGASLGTFAVEPNKNRDYTDLITCGPDNVVSYDPGCTAERHLLNGEATVLEGPLFSFTFEDAAILPDGSLANLKITYSNARIFTDERLKAMENVAKEHLADAQELLENATTPAEIAAAQEALDAANTELLASYYHGVVVMAQGHQIRHYGSDPRNLKKTSSGFSQAQIDAAQNAIEDRIDKYKIDAGLSDLTYVVSNGPSLGKSVDTTYEIVDDAGNPINGTFIFVNVGVNLDRDPYSLSAHNVNKSLWWVQDVDPNLHFLSEQIAVDNNSIASDYIYVRPNNDKIEDLLPVPEHISLPAVKRTGFYPQVVEAIENGATRTKFISNSLNTESRSGNDGYYSAGFVTLATSGFTVTAYGHGFSNGRDGSFDGMNVQAYGGKRIWYRYVSSTGTGGNIQTTSEGNFGGTLNDTKDDGTASNILGPGTYVVPEGKTVTYTLTPDHKYFISKLEIMDESGNMNEIHFDFKPLYEMEAGESVAFTDAAGNEGVLTAQADGVFTVTLPYALHDEEIHVEWEKIIGDLTVKKETVGDVEGAFDFRIKAHHNEDMVRYTPVGVGSMYLAEGVYETAFSQDATFSSDADTLAAAIAQTELVEKIAIAAGEYLWKTNVKLSALGIAHGSEDDYLYVEFINAPSATVGSTLDSVLNGDKEWIYFYHLYETTENVTAYWNFDSEAPQASDPGEYSFTLANGEERVFELPYDYQYEVYEQEKDGWRLISVNGDVEKLKVTGAITVEEDEKTETFLNKLMPTPTPVRNDFYFTFTKEWLGTPTEDVTFTLYNADGSVYPHKFNCTKLSDTRWKYECWLSAGGDYYVKEEIVTGYTTVYRNTGDHADATDRVYNRGTVINSMVPKTGDGFNPILWWALAAVSLAGIGGLAAAIIKSKKKK